MMTREQVPTLFEEFRKIFDPSCFIAVPELTRNEMSGLSLYEDEDCLYVEAFVPGVKSDEIYVSVEKGVVWIKAEQQEQKKDMKVHFRSARRYSYRLPLPVRIDDQTAPEAVCKDGILRVTFAKNRSCKPMKICVKAS